MSGQWTDAVAADGHRLQIYLARPEGEAKGAVVVLQEIFGVNAHIRSVCDRLAAAGYVAAAPALFDRLSQGYEAGYAPDDVKKGMELLHGFDFDRAIDDITAAVETLRPHGRVSIMGFCLGGSLAYKMATLPSGIASAACYYGGLIADYADNAPLCPVVLHYGATDPTIPPENVETVRQKQPDLPIHVYPAGHGFNCDARQAYEPKSASLAWERTMEMIDRASKA